jgi:ribosomal protein L14
MKLNTKAPAVTTQIARLVKEIGSLEKRESQLHVDLSNVVIRTDKPFAQRQKELQKQYEALDKQMVILNREREKARADARKPVKRELREVETKREQLVAEVKNLADEHEIVVTFASGSKYDPNVGNDEWNPSSWESSTC